MEHHFIDRYAELNSPIHRWDARIKTIFFFVAVIIFVSTPTKNFLTFAAYGVFLAIILILSKIPILFFMKRVLIVIPFVLAVGFFHLFSNKPLIERIEFLLGLFAKSLLSVSALILLVSTTKFSKLLDVLESFAVPEVFIKTLAFAYRYIFVLQDELMRMVQAAKAKNFAPKSLFRVKVFGWIIGSLFVRSYERAERVYLAMLARGFDGKFSRAQKTPIKFADAIAGLFNIAILIFARGFIL